LLDEAWDAEPAVIEEPFAEGTGAPIFVVTLEDNVEDVFKNWTLFFTQVWLAFGTEAALTSLTSQMSSSNGFEGKVARVEFWTWVGGKVSTSSSVCKRVYAYDHTYNHSRYNDAYCRCLLQSRPRDFANERDRFGSKPNCSCTRCGSDIPVEYER